MTTSIPTKTQAPAALRLFAATSSGPVPLPPAAGARDLNDAFDDFPLGIYEGLRTLDGTRLIGLPEHIERAERSIRRLGWPYELDQTVLCTCLATILAGNLDGDSRVRFDVLAEPIETAGGSTRLIFGIAPLVLPTAGNYRDGVGVETISELERDAPLIKQANFVIERRPFPLGGPETYERLLIDGSGRILEGTASSFLGVRGRTILAATGNVLEGITAGIVEGIAHGAGFKFAEEDLFVDDLATLDEAFLTSSIKGIVPVVRVDAQPIGSGTPGPVTNRLISRYQEFIQADARHALDALGTPAR